METKHTMKNAEKQTAKDLRLSALEIFNSYACGAEIDDVEKAGDILSKLAHGIVIPETLNRIADLLNEIASEVERLAETEHEAETPAIPTQAEWSAYAKTINQRKKNTP